MSGEEYVHMDSRRRHWIPWSWNYSYKPPNMGNWKRTLGPLKAQYISPALVRKCLCVGRGKGGLSMSIAHLWRSVLSTVSIPRVKLSWSALVASDFTHWGISLVRISQIFVNFVDILQEFTTHTFIPVINLQRVVFCEDWFYLPRPFWGSSRFR